MSPVETAQPQILQHITQLKQVIFQRRPILHDIIRKHGSKSLYQYAQDYLDINLNPVIVGRQAHFFAVFKKEIARLYGEKVATEAAAQMSAYYFASTADHVGPTVHPFFLNSNLIISAAYDECPDSLLRYVIVLSCANVSLGNSSFPRGLLFTSDRPGSPKILRLSFLPSTAHSASVYNFRAYTEREIQKVKTVILEQKKNGDTTEATATKLLVLVDDVYAASDVLARDNFSDQVAVTNVRLWNMFLANKQRPFPSLITIEQERLTTELLLTHHLDQMTTLHRLLFDEKGEYFMNKYFEGIMGAFSRQEKWGTYLFWGVSADKNYRVHLWKRGNSLVSNDGSFTLELTPEAVCDALRDKKIIPGMMLIYITISFYYGLKCLGGPNQVNYLTLLKKAYIDMCVEWGDSESVQACDRVQTKEFVEGPTLAFLRTGGKEILPAMGLDLYLYHEEKTWETIINLTKVITLEEAFNPRLPDYYPLMYPDIERIPALSALTAKEITESTGLDKKLQPCVTIAS